MRENTEIQRTVDRAGWGKGSVLYLILNNEQENKKNLGIELTYLTFECSGTGNKFGELVGKDIISALERTMEEGVVFLLWSPAPQKDKSFCLSQAVVNCCKRTQYFVARETVQWLTTLFLQRTQHTHGSLQPSLTPVPGDQTPSSDLRGHCTDMVHICINFSPGKTLTYIKYSLKQSRGL